MVYFHPLSGQSIGYEKADSLGQCGIGRPLWEQPCASLSGGERTRLLIAQALSGDPEALVLDEPTNHLDIPGIEWLEKTLKAFKGEVLVVSHDRFFLDAVATEIWEIRDTHLATFSGGYSQYQSRLREMQANEAKETMQWLRQDYPHPPPARRTRADLRHNMGEPESEDRLPVPDARRA